jgi:surface protein
MTTIDITNITGLSYPYDIYVCDIYGNNCILISTVFTSIPPSNTILLPPQFENSPSVGIKVITLDGCERFKIIECYSVITPFISIWDTTNTSGGSSLSNQIQLPLVDSLPYYFNIDWGDGSTDTITSWDQPETLHTYTTPGIYTLTISGYVPDWSFGASLVPDYEKILSITQWGCLQFGGYESLSFLNCINLDLSSVVDIPNLSSPNITFDNAFSNCTSITTINNLNNWDLSNVLNTIAMFAGCINFNQDISNWDTSNIENMNTMFENCTTFNSDISSWDMSNVTSISRMFRNATSFNQPIGTWDVSSVIAMYETFRGASSFNQNIDSWDVSNVTTMFGMFQSSSFNQPLSGWNVSNVTNMSYMFFFNTSFNQNLNLWNTSNVVNMEGMFYLSYNFNGNITSWDTSSVINMQSMFAGATIFNQNISGWNVSGVTNMNFMFVGDSYFNQPIGSWDVSNVTTMNSMFGSGAFNQDIGSWNVSNVTNFSQFMYGKSFTDFSTTNLDAIYNGWSSLPSLNSGLNINFGTIKYTAGGSAGKSILSGTYGWTITDGGI